MTGDRERMHDAKGTGGASGAKQKKLAEALRRNLVRRKTAKEAARDGEQPDSRGDRNGE